MSQTEVDLLHVVHNEITAALGGQEQHRAR